MAKALEASVEELKSPIKKDLFTNQSLVILLSGDGRLDRIISPDCQWTFTWGKASVPTRKILYFNTKSKMTCYFAAVAQKC